MNFFRKYFVHLALLFVGLALLAYVMRYFVFDEEQKSVSREIREVEIDFTKEGELSVFKGDTLLKTLDIEFADTLSERELGLMYRKSMAENQGMLFIYPDQQPELSFYMKNTYIPLDIIYINSEMQIVSIVRNAKPLDETSLPSGKPAQYVLEINGGRAAAWGIEVGDTVTYE
ncbi:MAG: DUF192 domain-containing protein [Capnocytophaga sp.]|nr:DUF192 domain-containing protein [Capnocytophaga sp.]